MDRVTRIFNKVGDHFRDVVRGVSVRDFTWYTA